MNKHHWSRITGSILPLFSVGILCMVMTFLLISTGTVKAGKCDFSASMKCMKMTTTAKSGLRMRDDPSINGKVIATVPDNTTVILVGAADRKINLSGMEGYWMQVCWEEKSISGWVFSGFLKKKNEPGFRFNHPYCMIYSRLFAEGEEAEIQIKDGMWPEDLKQAGNKMELSQTLPPAYEVHYSLTGANKKLTKDENKCYRILFKILKIEFKQVDEGSVANVRGHIVSVKSVKASECTD